MSIINGFISDQTPKHSPLCQKHQNLPKQISKDPYRSSKTLLSQKNIINSQQLQPIIIQTQNLNQNNYIHILKQQKLFKENPSTHSKNTKNSTIRKIIDNHLFDDNIKKKISKASTSQKQNRYQSILRQVYGSPLTQVKIKNNTKNQQNTLKRNNSMKKYQSTQKLIRKTYDTTKQTNTKGINLKQNNNDIKSSCQNKANNKQMNRCYSYHQLYLKQKKLYI